MREACGLQLINILNALHDASFQAKISVWEEARGSERDAVVSSSDKWSHHRWLETRLKTTEAALACVLDPAAHYAIW